MSSSDNNELEYDFEKEYSSSDKEYEIRVKDKKSKDNKDENKPFSFKDEIREWLIAIEVAVVLAVVLNMFIIVNAIIPSASMENTIMTGDRIFGNRLAYLTSDPERGDIVIFKFPDDEKQLFIKRVIGLPGETLEMIDGKIYINHSLTPLDEPYVNKVPYGNYGPVEIPEGAYFVMGDNRNNSADSRYWKNTFVYKEKILGKAWFRYYKKFGPIE